MSDPTVANAILEHNLRMLATELASTFQDSITGAVNGTRCANSFLRDGPFVPQQSPSVH
jgi:hypothetical protein